MTSQQIQYGGRPPYWKSFFGCISIYCPINAKFAMMKHNHVLTQNTWPNFANSRRWMAAILKIVLLLYLSRKSSDFNEIQCGFGSKNGHVTNYQNFANPIWPMATILKIVLCVHLHDLLSEIWCEDAQSRSDTGNSTRKYQILKI